MNAGWGLAYGFEGAWGRGDSDMAGLLREGI
jgi:hypothetical protein